MRAATATVHVPESAAPIKEAARPARAKLQLLRGGADATPQGRENALRYLPFVRRIAGRVARGLPSHVAMDDLVSAGMIGLLDALDRFDPSKGGCFESYAEFRVRGSILDDLRRSDIMARDARLESKRIQRAIASLSQQLGRAPEEEELAAHLDLSIEDLRKTLHKLRHVQVVSIDDANEWDPDGWSGGVSSDDPYENACVAEIREKLMEAIPQLPPRLRMAITLYYYEKLPIKAIASLMDVTESRVSQMTSEAVHRLRVIIGTDRD